jgi:peptidoglycan/xylan/chitin deacetylase (PgdA/CDA1 family)
MQRHSKARVWLLAVSLLCLELASGCGTDAGTVRHSSTRSPTLGSAEGTHSTESLSHSHATETIGPPPDTLAASSVLARSGHSSRVAQDATVGQTPGDGATSGGRSAPSPDTRKQQSGREHTSARKKTHAPSSTTASSKAHGQSLAAVNVDYWNHEPRRANAGRTVVLTFDDGPSPWTGQLIQTLDAERVPAMFFWNTYHIQYADGRVRSELQTSPQILVGDHTVDHQNLNHLDYQEQYREIVGAQRTIERLLGRPVLFFRPPYGNYNAVTEQILNRQHLTPVMWDVDSLDWKYGSNKAAFLAEVQRQVHPGAIILMHDHYDTIRFLPDVIRMLRRDGYGFTTFTVAKSIGGH